MPRHRPHLPRSPHRATAAITLLCFLLASFGLLPSPSWLWSRLPTLQDYPCAGHGCGCTSLEHCWAACHCFSRPQRLAWSIRHNASIPESARPTDAEWQLAGAVVAGVSNPQSPPCPLCHVEPAEDAGPPQQAAATLSALGCRADFPWITIPAVPADPRGPVFVLAPSAGPRPIKPGAEPRPASRSLDAPVPPPRMA